MSAPDTAKIARGLTKTKKAAFRAKHWSARMPLLADGYVYWTRGPYGFSILKFRPSALLIRDYLQENPDA